MERIIKVQGYDIYRLSKEDCFKNDFCYPTYLVFFEGEESGVDIGIYETAEDSYLSAYKWCLEHSRE